MKIGSPLVKFGKFLVNLGNKIDIEGEDDNLSNMETLLSQAGQDLVNERENDCTVTPKEDVLMNTHSNLSPYDLPQTQTLEDNLALVRRLYLEAKHNLENNSFDPNQFTVAEEILFSEALVNIVDGNYFGHRVHNYTNGIVYLSNPDYTDYDSKGRPVSHWKNANPILPARLSTLYPFFEIKCRFPKACIKKLFAKLDYFNDIVKNPNLLDKYSEEVYRSL